MRSILAVQCAQRTTPPQPVEPVVPWAKDLVARPERYGADERTRNIVAHLLSQVEVAR